MEYMYNGLQLKGRNLQDDQKIRLLIYYIHLQTLVSEKKEHDERYGKNQLINIFWDKESKWEQKIYGWTERMGEETSNNGNRTLHCSGRNPCQYGCRRSFGGYFDICMKNGDKA